MAGRIPQSFIDDLLMRIDIVDVIDAQVPLKRAGKNHQACCPFHNEKTPSFTVSQEKQFYHCFGCGANGTAISFLMEYSGMSFPEAVEDLANRCGLAIPKEVASIEVDKDRAELYELMELITRYYTRQLREHPEAETAVNYLKQRGLTGEIASEFEIGFAPPGWDNLLSQFGQSDAAKTRLEKVGMTIKKDNGGYYDRFRNRIMFPIRDTRNRVIGFGGRVLGDDTPKYLNSPETPIFRKRYELYGLYQARKSSRTLKQIYIVEGYMDVLALAQYDVRNTVATLGTAATTDQIEKLYKKSSELVFCFDGDTAGLKAAWRALETTLPLIKDGRQCWFLFIPEGEDPDSFVRSQGKQAFQNQQLKMSLSDYLFQELQKGLDLHTPEGRAAYLEKAKAYVQKIPATTYREMIVSELAKQTGLQPEQMHIPNIAQVANNRKPATRKAIRPQQSSMTPVRRSIRMLLNFPTLAQDIESLEALSQVKQHGIPFLIELIQYIQQSETAPTMANIIENWRDTPTENALMELARSEELLTEPEQLSNEFTTLINKLVNDDKKLQRQSKAREIKSVEDLKKLHQSTDS